MLKNDFDGLQHIGIPTLNLNEVEKFWEKLGFTKIGDFPSGKVIFMEKDHLVIETWQLDNIVDAAGAINHISLNVKDIDQAFLDAKKEGFSMIDNEIQSLPFWENGIKYFNIRGPEGVIIEFCEIL